MARVAQVAINKLGGFKILTRKAFLSLPTAEKKTLISGKKIEFIDENGKNIPFMEGVKDILSGN